MEPTILAAILNGGALAILAYHFLVGLPAILDRISKDQQTERLFWAGEADKDRNSFHARTTMLIAEMRSRDTELRELLARRLGVLEDEQHHIRGA